MSMKFCCFWANKTTDLATELLFDLALDGTKNTVLLIFLRLCYSSTLTFHTNKCKQSYFCTHSHDPKMKFFAKTTLSLLKGVMGQGRILPAWWPLLRCKYLADFGLGGFCNTQEGAKNERDIRRGRSRSQQVSAMFSQGSVISAHRYNLHMQLVISVLCLPCIPTS